MVSPFPHRYLVVEGNIGAGKTTLCRMLESDYDARLILEQFTDNPFLPSFYEDRSRFAFQVELFFMAERHRQLQDSLSQTSIFEQFIVGDYFFLKTLLFAKNNLKQDEYRLFSRLFSVLNTTFAKPDLLLYIHRPVDVLLENIRKRARNYEQDIDAAYLQEIQTAYLDYFKTQDQIPVLIVDFADIDFTVNENQYKRVTELLYQSYQPGTHFLKL